MNLKDQVEEIVINDLPEFYRFGSRECFLDTGMYLLERGLTIHEVRKVLTDLCSAMTNEYD